MCWTRKVLKALSPETYAGVRPQQTSFSSSFHSEGSIHGLFKSRILLVFLGGKPPSFTVHPKVTCTPKELKECTLKEEEVLQWCMCVT